MRLWHQKLIPYLDNKRLLGQHRECCALRGKGWGKKHSVVDYVFKYTPSHLYEYHLLVMQEMMHRNYNVDGHWYGRLYRGKNVAPYHSLSESGTFTCADGHIYDEHDNAYLKECLLNLKSKGACLVNGASIEKMLIEIELNEHA